MIPSYTSTNFTKALLNLLPNGRVWPKFPSSNLYKAISALTGAYARSTDEGLPPTTTGEEASSRGNANRAADILLDTMPTWSRLGAGAVTELLPEWQRTLGLPDPCVGELPTQEQEIRQAVARFIALGGQSIQYYEQFAFNLGYDINVLEYEPFRTDSSGAGADLADDDAAYIWQVFSSDDGSWLFAADVNTGEEALGGFGNVLLECELQRIKPAHTVLTFAYPPGGIAAMFDDEGLESWVTCCVADGHIMYGYVGDDAAKWTSGVLSLIPYGAISKVFGCNADGSILVGQSEGLAVSGSAALTAFLTVGDMVASAAVATSSGGETIAGWARTGPFATIPDVIIPVRWDAVNIYELPTINGPGYAIAISDDENIIVGNDFNLPVKWVSGVRYELPVLSFVGGAVSGMTRDATVITGRCFDSVNKPVIWTASGIIVLALPTGATDGWANGCSFDASVIVGGATFADGIHAVVWRGGVPYDRGFAPDAAFAEATCCSNTLAGGGTGTHAASWLV